MLSFSTCWNSQRHTEGEHIVHEIKAMGFDTIEISHGLKVSLLPGLQKVFREGRIKVSGLHNFCPSPVELMIDAPDAYEFTSHRPHDRERAMTLTLKTLEFAAQFEAKYVVLHLGSVPVKKYTDRLEALLTAGKLNSREYIAPQARVCSGPRKGGAALRPARAGGGDPDRRKGQGGRSAGGAWKAAAILSRCRPKAKCSRCSTISATTRGSGTGTISVTSSARPILGCSTTTSGSARCAPHWLGCHLHDVEWPHRDHRVPLTAGGVDFDSLDAAGSPRAARWCGKSAAVVANKPSSTRCPRWRDRFGAW